MKALLRRVIGWLSRGGVILLAYAVVLAIVAEPLWRLMLPDGGR
jgi:hypothetical protein